MASQGNPAHGLSGSEVWPPHLSARGSPQKPLPPPLPPPPSELLTSLRQEETVKRRGREAGAGLRAEGGWGRGDVDGARRADGRAVNPRWLIALWGMASCQQR